MVNISFAVTIKLELTLTDLIEEEAEELCCEEEITLRLSCFTHSLQLVIRDDLSNVPYLSKMLAKCKQLLPTVS